MKRTQLVSIILILACSTLISGAVPVDPFAQMAAVGADVDARFEIIRVEAQQATEHDWAGTYYQGDGLGMNVSMVLAPQEGVAARWNGCLGRYGSNHGGIFRESDGSLRFQFKHPNPAGFGGFPDNAMPVRWADRHYLIPKSELVEFVNAINNGYEPRAQSHGSFLLAEGDQHKPVSGLPALPPRYQQLIRTEALTTQVTAVHELADLQNEVYCSKRFQLELDRGSDDGLVTGVELAVSAQQDIGDPMVIIVSTQATTSQAELTRYIGDTCDSWQAFAPAPGWQLTTGALDTAAANLKIADAKSYAESLESSR